MRYVLQDAADRLGCEDINLEDIDWHLLQPEHVIALVAALREDGYAPNTSSLYVNAVRGVMNEAWRMNLIDQEHLLRMRTVKAAPGTRLGPRPQPAAYADSGNDGGSRCRPQASRAKGCGGDRDSLRLGHAQVGVGQP